MMKQVVPNYPITPKEDVSEEHFGIRIEDPYRRLEDDSAEETVAWLKEQQVVTEGFLSRYPHRKAMLERLKELIDYPKQSVPYKMGDWYYYSRNDGLQNQWVLYRKASLDGVEEVFLDPNTLSEDGTTSASWCGYSKDYRYFSFRVSPSGADAGEIWTMDSRTKAFLPDKITNVRHSGAYWWKDGFFYSRYDNTQDYQSQDANMKIYYHTLGQDNAQDRLIYQDPDDPLRFHHIWVSDDEKTLFLYSTKGTRGSRILYRAAEGDSPWQTLFEGFEFDAFVFDAYENGFVYMYTNKHAPNFRLLKVDLSRPQEENWQEIIPERDYLLVSAQLAGGKLLAIFTKDVSSQIEVFDTAGNYLYPIPMPYQGAAYLHVLKKEEDEAYFGFDSFIHPHEYYHYDIKDNKLTYFHCDPIKADVSKIVSEQVFYPSLDGTMIPLTIIYREGMVRNGLNPCLLYGYGGFSISLMPSFSDTRVALLEKGFIYAIANLRGGNEYGEAWHEAGMKLNKQNVFDDFIAAAEYLIRGGYTSSQKLAINGGSNGGLLVGACLTQRPDLYKVAVPQVGVLDMLRYHKFTCGWGWMAEYGNPEEEEHFKNLLAYSPLHNIKAKQKYPATMITTADHDDRVIPGHSFKFAATLQEKADPGNPVLLYTQFQSSHGTSSTTKSLELIADVYSFICMTMGV
ncbi:MAG: prolyl oligopeptidase family serine peptidase [Candidatus Cloacimonetes bacterium]|nr:prolyl oligopeptidase family serine peptidase [Candidatus Cloacimonadota bacterium]